MVSKTCPDCGKDGLQNLGMHISQTNCEFPTLSENDVQILTGTLMGDASIRPSGLYELSTRSKEYVVYVSNQLPEWLITKSGVHPVFVGGDGESYNTEDLLMYRIRTVSHPTIKQLREQWYSNGVKTFPLDSLEATSTVMQHWYCTDGSVDASGRPTISSSNEDTEELRDWLQEQGFDVCRDENTVRFNKDGAQLLYEMIESCPGYEYKLDGILHND